MSGAAHTFCVHRPKYEESCSGGGGGEGLSRDRERMIAEMLRQRQESMLSGQHPGQGGMYGGRHPGMGGMGGHPPQYMGGHGMHPMMGDMSPQGFRSSMGVGMMPGMERLGGVGMGMHPAMGRMGGMSGHMPHMGHMPHQSPFAHSPFPSHRHSPFSYSGPGPPRAHSMFPQHPHSHGHSPFSQPRHRPFSSSRRIFDYDDDYYDNYRMPSQRAHGRHMRGGYGVASRHPATRRGYRSGMFEDSDDDFDEYDEYEDEFQDEDEYGRFGDGRAAQMRWRGGGYY
jgi:hypothetical protein